MTKVKGDLLEKIQMFRINRRMEYRELPKQKIN
ncbi:hypothetical protein TUN_48250 [Bacillus sp. M21]|nr:hypothetical protein TUN_48250 [Bacillus sp. M21]